LFVTPRSTIGVYVSLVTNWVAGLQVLSSVEGGQISVGWQYLYNSCLQCCESRSRLRCGCDASARVTNMIVLLSFYCEPGSFCCGSKTMFTVKTAILMDLHLWLLEVTKHSGQRLNACSGLCIHFMSWGVQVMIGFLGLVNLGFKEGITANLFVGNYSN